MSSREPTLADVAQLAGVQALLDHVEARVKRSRKPSENTLS